MQADAQADPASHAVPPPAAPVIELDDIHLTLGEGASRVHVLRGMSLSVPPGRSVGVVGPSGSGKSTLLMVLAGLEPVDEGRVWLAGEDFSHLDEDGLAAFCGRNIGLILANIICVVDNLSL